MPSKWENIFKATPIPSWLHYFDRDQDAAVDDAVKGKYFFDSLNIADPAELLIDWAQGLGAQFQFVQRLDQALTNWIEKNWGERMKEPRVIRTLAWMRILQIVATVETLRQAPRALRKYFDQRRTFLEPLCEGPSRDPLGIYLHAIASHQQDHSLTDAWWDCCKLAPGIPWYHGLYGITGLRGLPPRSERVRGAFPEAVARGVACLGQALYRQSQEQRIRLAEAHAEFDNVAHLTLVAYPFPERWRECWEKEIAAKTVGRVVKNWMVELLPGINKRPKDNPPRSEEFAMPLERLREIDQLLAQLIDPERSFYKPFIEVTGIGGIGKTVFLEQLWKSCRTRRDFRCARVVLKNFTNLATATPNALIREIVNQIGVRNNLFEPLASSRVHAQPPEDLTLKFVEYLQAVLAKRGRNRYVALFLDADDNNFAVARRWLLTVFKEMIAAERIMIVIAHERTFNFSHHPQLQDKVYSLRLEEFDRYFTRQQLSSLGLFEAASPLGEKWLNLIYGMTGGHPLANQVVAAKVRQEGSQPEEVQSHYGEFVQLVEGQVVVSKILRRYHDDEIANIKQLLTPLAIPRLFSLGSMARLIEKFAPEQQKAKILDYAYTINELRGFIRHNKSTSEYSVIPSLRGALSASLQDDNQEKFIRINKYLAGFYVDGSEETSGIEKVRFFLEKIYHLIQLGKTPKFLLSEFEAFAQRIQQTEAEIERLSLLLCCRNEFEQDAEIKAVFDAAVRQKIYALFSLTAKQIRRVKAGIARVDFALASRENLLLALQVGVLVGVVSSKTITPFPQAQGNESTFIHKGRW